MAKLQPLPSPLATLPLLCLLVLAAPPPALSRSAPGNAVDGSSIHKLLKDHGLPGGLLPRGVESYTMDESNGLLEARLSAPCYAKYDDGELAYFDTVVRGNLSMRALRGVEGLAQEELFVWFPVKGILVDDKEAGVIQFDIGYAHKRLSRSLFEEPPDCKPSAAAGMGAVDAARWKDRQGVPGLRLRRKVGDGHRQNQR
ncbi:uncharacterized protein LOC133891159 isoform X2 [Phragmites australis]|uniref:uncharacterized protein LOC133891159 isoform X2 n=1 Tax=Phragmites australis TaxID=29695 RepID=UPI002D79B6D0|nr:uncharacterized protein LOC133891159 isoform X2 [Phragmites australis]